MSSNTLSSLYTGLLKFSGNIDLSTLSNINTETELEKQLKTLLTSTQWKHVCQASPTEYQTPFIAFTDPEYPEHLKRTPFAPPVIFYRGNIDLLLSARPNIAIVGARNVSRDSLSFTSRLAWAAYSTHNIIGGLTFGIEEVAQHAILSKKTQKVRLLAVLEQGFDCVKGHRLKWLTKLVERNGLVISAYPPDQRVQRWQYKERNHLLAMLSDKIVLVEASKTSGSISTALYGSELGKEVYAVPHHPNKMNGHGCLHLIEQGAAPLWDPTHLFGIQNTEHTLLNSLSTPLSLEALAESQQSTPSDTLETLLELKRLGYIRQRGALWERL